MKTSILCSLLGAAGFLFTMPAASVQAGSVVVVDADGAWGFYHGDFSEKELERKAAAQCRAKSKHPGTIREHSYFDDKGDGVIVRYTVDGEKQLTAMVAENGKVAYQSCLNFIRKQHGEDIEVLARWTDE